MFARSGEREVDLGLDCRLIIAANLGHDNKIEQFFSSRGHYGRRWNDCNNEILGIAKKMIVNPVPAKPTFGLNLRI